MSRGVFLSRDSRPNVDFGRGFYVTPLFEQAAKWCGKFKRRGKDGIISRYLFDEKWESEFAAAWNADDWTFEALECYYKTLVRYLNLDDRGMVLGYGCGTVPVTKQSQYPDKAYQLGRKL